MRQAWTEFEKAQVLKRNVESTIRTIEDLGYTPRSEHLEELDVANDAYYHFGAMLAECLVRHFARNEDSLNEGFTPSGLVRRDVLE